MIEHFGVDKVAKRFWQKVRVGCYCWEWTASKNKDGYGLLMCRNKSAGFPGSLLKAHKVSWEIHFGPVPAGAHVLHTCDNRACVHPGHLYLGTHQKNMRDMAERKRANNGRLSGDDHPRAVLSSKIVQELRSRHEAGESIANMARELNVKRGTVWAAVKGQNW